MGKDKIEITDERMHKLQAYVGSHKLPLTVKVWRDHRAVEQNSPDIYAGDDRTIMDNISSFCGLFYIDGYMEVSVHQNGEECVLYHFDCDEGGTFIPRSVTVDKMLGIVA